MFALDENGEEEHDAVDLSDFRVIGRGRSSTVYLARSAALGRPVAVKVFDATVTRSTAAWARFERRSRIVGGLSDRLAVVPIHHIETSAGTPKYVVMAYLEGGSIADLTRTLGPLTEPQIVGLGESLAGTLAVAHGLGVVHGDIKPSNLLVSGGGTVRMSDFATAALRPRPRARTTPPPHVAPEVLRGEEATERSDVYSLASTLYELVQGEPPFRRGADETVAALITRQQTERPPEPAAVRQAALVGGLMAALDPDPRNRPVAADFQLWLGDFDLEPLVDARRPAPAVAVGPIVAHPLLGPEVSAPAATEPATEPAEPPEPAVDHEQVATVTPLARRPSPNRGRAAAWIGAAAALLAAFVATTAWRNSNTDDRAAAPTTFAAATTLPDPPTVAEAAPAAGPDTPTTEGPVTTTTISTTTASALGSSTVTVAASSAPSTVVRSTTTTRPATTATAPVTTVAPATAAPTTAPPPPTTVRTAPPPTVAVTTPATTTTTVTTLAPSTAPPATAPTTPSPPPPPPKPTVGSLSVSTSANGVRVTANAGDRCANSRWVLSGPVGMEQSSTAPPGCFPNPHGFDSTWYQLSLTPGNYTISLTLTNGAGSNSSSANFTIG